MVVGWGGHGLSDATLLVSESYNAELCMWETTFIYLYYGLLYFIKAFLHICLNAVRCYLVY